MSAKLHLVEDAGFAPEFGPTGALRQDFGRSGRIHLDRPLPFIALHRLDPDDADSLAQRVATTSPAYAVWPGTVDDGAAMAALRAVVAEQKKRFGRILLISLHDLEKPRPAAADSPNLPEFTARIGASGDPAAKAAADALAEALAKVEIDLRLCDIERVAEPFGEPGLETLAEAQHASRLSLGLPRIYLAPDGIERYPQLFHELALNVFDALLQAACAFMKAAGLGTPRHYRVIGRSAFIDAARSVDAKLDRICGRFDFLLSVSPINSVQAFDRFRADRYETPPEFRYRPLTVDPDEAKRTLYRIDLKGVEDPVLERLFSEKREELDHQLNMLACRNTDRFRFASLMLYAPVDTALREAATDILAADIACAPSRSGHVDCFDVADAAKTMVEAYAGRDPAFDVSIELRDDIAAGMMVSGRRLLISTATRIPTRRLAPLLHHEVGVHLLTFVNGSKQGLAIFKRGLAGYEGIQEGLGVFAEWAVGGLTRARIRLLAARVVAVDAMTDGAGFIEVFRQLRREHAFSAQAAFTIAARVFRSGGLAKDAIYLRGFKQVMDRLAAGDSLAPYWYGKIAAEHVPVVEELAERGILTRPSLEPEFLADPGTRARIERFRADPGFGSLA
jgi:uncharacterized protein (TIGR02421 family)